MAPSVRRGAGGGGRPSRSARVTALLLLLTFVPPSAGHQEYVPYNPNGANAGVAAIGHTDPNGGGDTNSYGSDFHKAGSYKSAYGPALCAIDSDGDGQSNGFELGDECCKWTHAAQTPLRSDSISNPGDRNSVSSRAACDGSCAGLAIGLPPCACCGFASNSSSPSATPSVSSSPTPSPSNGSSASPTAGSGGGGGGVAASPALIGGAAGGGGLVVGFLAAAALFGLHRRRAGALAGGRDEYDAEGGFAPLDAGRQQGIN